MLRCVRGDPADRTQVVRRCPNPGLEIFQVIAIFGPHLTKRGSCAAWEGFLDVIDLRGSSPLELAGESLFVGSNHSRMNGTK
jgi:hypothetical protein